MPPRYAYWTVLVDGQPTAFRAADQEELLPTFNRLKEKSPSAEMKWFERGQLWDSRDQAHATFWRERHNDDYGVDTRRDRPRGVGSWRDDTRDGDRAARPMRAPDERSGPDARTARPSAERPTTWRADRPAPPREFRPSRGVTPPDDRPASARGAEPAAPPVREPDWRDDEPDVLDSTVTDDMVDRDGSEILARDDGDTPEQPGADAYDDTLWPKRASDAGAMPDIDADEDDLSYGDVDMSESGERDERSAEPPDQSAPVARESKPRAEPPRNRQWRPGGEHKDPRQKYKDAKKDKWSRFKQNIRSKWESKQGPPEAADRQPRPEGTVRPPAGDRPRIPWKPRPGGSDLGPPPPRADRPAFNRQDRGGDRPRNSGGYRSEGQGGPRSGQAGYRSGGGGYDRDRKPGGDRPWNSGSRPESHGRPRPEGPGAYRPEGQGFSPGRKPGGFAPRGPGGWKAKPGGGGSDRGARPAWGHPESDRPAWKPKPGGRPASSDWRQKPGGFKPRSPGGFKPKGPGGTRKKRDE